MYQNPAKYSRLFDSTFHQFDVDLVSQFIASDKILDQGGLTTLSSQTGFYSTDEIKLLLQDISNRLVALEHVSNKRFSLSMSIYNTFMGAHALTLVHELSEAGAVWHFMDINNEGSILYPTQDLNLLLKTIQDNYFLDKTTRMMMRIASITTKISADNQPEFKNILDSINPQTTTPIETKRIQLIIALVSGDIHFIEQSTLDEINYILITAQTFLQTKNKFMIGCGP